MVTIVLNSGKVFRDAERLDVNKTLVHIDVKRSDVNGDELMALMNGGEVYCFRESMCNAGSWTVGLHPEAIKSIR